MYEPLCEFLGIKKKQQTCEKYPHFLKILHEFVKIIKESIKTKPFGKQLLSSGIETKKCVASPGVKADVFISSEHCFEIVLHD